MRTAKRHLTHEMNLSLILSNMYKMVDIHKISYKFIKVEYLSDTFRLDGLRKLGRSYLMVIRQCDLMLNERIIHSSYFSVCYIFTIFIIYSLVK